MNNLKNILLFIITLFFISCEKTEIVDVNLEGNDKIVVQAEVKAGGLFKGVTFTKTMPVGVKYDIKQAEITNAYVYLQINGVKVVPLYYTANGLYLPLHNNLEVIEGDIYELFAKINGKPVYAKTKVPLTPRVLSVSYNSTGYYNLNVRALPGEVYGAVWLISLTPARKADNYYSVEESNQGSNASVSIRTQAIPEVYLSDQYKTLRHAQVFAFDRQFSDYFKTQVQNNPSDNNLLLGGLAVKWNVVGENVIGLFIGIAEGKLF